MKDQRGLPPLPILTSRTSFPTSVVRLISIWWRFGILHLAFKLLCVNWTFIPSLHPLEYESQLKHPLLILISPSLHDNKSELLLFFPPNSLTFLIHFLIPFFSALPTALLPNTNIHQLVEGLPAFSKTSQHREMHNRREREIWLSNVRI